MLAIVDMDASSPISIRIGEVSTGGFPGNSAAESAVVQKKVNNKAPKYFFIMAKIFKIRRLNFIKSMMQYFLSMFPVEGEVKGAGPRVMGGI